MGDTSIIARRRADGQVEYGWSGNGGYFKMVGIRLLIWYSHPGNIWRLVNGKYVRNGRK